MRTKGAVTKMGAENSESKKLFLEALLAEYKRLTDQLMNHNKNMGYLFAVMVGGIATILGFFGFTEIVSFLAIPIFVSGCGTLILLEGFSSATITYYIIEEIEHEKLLRLFPHGSPIQFDKIREIRYGWLTGVLWIILFLLSFFLCLGCLINASVLVWSQVSQNVFFQTIYVFGWITTMFYAVSTTFLYYKLLRERKRVMHLKT